MGEAKTGLMDSLIKLPLEMQEALCWISDHMEFVDCICTGDMIPEEKWKRDMDLAAIRGDSLGIALLAYKYIKDGCGNAKN